MACEGGEAPTAHRHLVDADELRGVEPGPLGMGLHVLRHSYSDRYAETQLD